jgi:lysozyme family protein
MANFEYALNYALSNETIGFPDEGTIEEKMAKLKSGKLFTWFSNVKFDPGGSTAWGITLNLAKSYGVDTVDKLKNMTPNDVRHIYKTEFWRFDHINNDKVAAKLFDMRINFTGSAFACVQNALGINADNKYGPATETSINKVDPDEMLKLLVDASVAYYIEHLRNHPEEEKFRGGWTTRAQKVPV